MDMKGYCDKISDIKPVTGSSVTFIASVAAISIVDRFTNSTILNIAALIMYFDDAIILSNSSARPVRLVWAGSLFGQNEVTL